MPQCPQGARSLRGGRPAYPRVSWRLQDLEAQQEQVLSWKTPYQVALHQVWVWGLRCEQGWGVGWIVPLQHSYVGVLSPSSSECDLILQTGSSLR